MKSEEFASETMTLPLFRILRVYRRGRMAAAVSCIAIVAFLAAFIDRTINLRVWTVPFIVLLACILAFEAAQRFAGRMKLVLDSLDQAMLDNSSADRAIRAFIGRPSWDLLWGFGVALVGGFLVYASAPSGLPRMSHTVFGVVCGCGGAVFGFALMKYLWDYRLLWVLTSQPVSIWKVHKLKQLTAFNYSLTLIALLPCLITLYMWANRRTPELLAFAVTQGILAACIFVIAEIRIVRMVRDSDLNILDRVSAIEEHLWKEIDGASCNRALIVSELAHLETLRRSLASGTAFGLISWGEFMAKIAVPFVAGAIGVIYQILSQK